jgi:hypothetical protein
MLPLRPSGCGTSSFKKTYKKTYKENLVWGIDTSRLVAVSSVVPQ